MDSYMIEIANKNQAPEQSYIIYDMAGKIYFVDRKNYLKFINFYLANYDGKSHYTMDLAWAESHSLIFDFDFKYENVYDSKYINNYYENFLIPTFKSLFNNIPSFTVIVTLRNNLSGIHIHLPEFVISHDDYIILCSQLQNQLNRKFDDFNVTLDIVKNFNLARSSKVNCSPYVPATISYYEHNSSLTIPLDSEQSFEDHIQNVRKQFKSKKNNNSSIFKELLYFNFILARERIYFYMMPIIIKNSGYKLCFETNISANVNPNFQQIATFVFKNSECWEISKSTDLKFNDNNYLKSLKFIKSYENKISHFKSNNYALKTWLKKSKRNYCIIDDVFKVINRLLVDENSIFVSDNHPVKKVMEFNRGYYFLPVFYALCNYLSIKCSQVIKHLRDANVSEIFLRKMENINDDLIRNISSSFTINTILYCSSNLKPKSSTFGEELIKIIKKLENSIESCLSSDDLSDVIILVIERFIPIMVATLKNSCKKPIHYMWNIIKEQWQEIKHDQDIKNVIINIKTKIKKVYRNSEKKNIVFDCCKDLNVTDVYATISSESNMNRKSIAMDQHKWHVKTKGGVLDLLTGHVGGTVPEFYLSGLQMGVNLTLDELISLRNDEILITVYTVLISKTFFEEYMKNLFLNLTDNFHDTLKLTAEQFEIHYPENEIVNSMLHFYGHLCKYMSFEFEMFQYMMDVLASTLIATNYCRHFFIFQGVTGNGKSKFFEMFSKVFGDYSHFIRSINLHSIKNLNAQPEMASSLFNKRIILIEELYGKVDENLIKEITGNSQTSFRMLYEQNTGGCPTAKIFAATNNPPVCDATEAFRSRVITFPFNSKFVSYNRNVTTSEQIHNDTYKIDRSDAVVNESCLGFFVLIYIHLFRNISNVDGLIHLRPEPMILKEFKEHYLEMTSLYMQFKQYTDVQIILNEITTRTEVISAINQFIVETKRVGQVKVSDILSKFDAEFKDYKISKEEENYLEMSSDDEDYSSTDDDESNKKRKNTSSKTSRKKKNTTTITYYTDISIKKLKKKLN